MSDVFAWVRRRWRLAALVLVILSVALVWAVFPSLLGGTPEGPSDVRVAELSCPECDFVDLTALDLDTSDGTYPAEELRSALDTGQPPLAMLGADTAQLAFTVGNESQDAQVLVTGIEVEVRAYEALSPPLRLACQVPERGGVGITGEPVEATRFTLALDPGLVGTSRTIQLDGQPANPVRLRPTGLQRYVGELELTSPGRYDIGVQVSYDTSGGVSETIESETLQLLRLPVPAGPDVAMIPSDAQPVCQSADFPADGPPRLLSEVEVDATDDGVRIRFAFADGMPAVRVERVEPPIRAQPSGRPVEVEGTQFLAVQMAPASGVDLSGEQPRQTYEGPDRFAPDASPVTEVVLTEDSPGLMTWVVGLDGPAAFVFDRESQTVQLLVSPRD